MSSLRLFLKETNPFLEASVPPSPWVISGRTGSRAHPLTNHCSGGGIISLGLDQSGLIPATEAPGTMEKDKQNPWFYEKEGRMVDEEEPEL